MTYLFHELDKLCRAFNFSINYPKGTPCLTKSFRHETEKIKKLFIDIYFEPYSQQSFEKFITLHHTVLITRLDELVLELKNGRLQSPSAISAEFQDKAEAILSGYAQLSDLLEFIHSHFSSFLPRQLPIPKQSLDAPLREVGEAKAFIDLVITNTCTHELKNLIKQPFNEFLDDKNQPTWDQLFYCRALHNEVKWLTQNLLPDNDSLMWMLYRINYNHPSYYSLLTNYIQELEPDNYHKTLYNIRRKTRQLIIIPDVVYKHDHPAISKLLENWLTEEIAYLEKSVQLSSPGTRGVPLAEKAAVEKVQANMSVAELAFLFKTLKDTGLIKIPNYNDFFQTMASTYCTRQSPNLSADSFRNKFYSHEPAIRKTVRTHIIALMNKINSTP